MGWASMANRMLGVAVRTFSEPTAEADPEGAVYWLVNGVEPGQALPWAVFDSAHVATDLETGAPISSPNPILGVRLSDLPAPPTSNDQVRARGTLYRISDVQPDGVAGVTIVLKKAGLNRGASP